MPKRSRNGVVRRPVRVVAPISVNGASVIFTERADGPFADDQIELEILHRGIEDFLDRRIEAVDLVDEEHVARLEIGQERREIACPRQHRARGRAKTDAELARDDLGQRRLAETGRAREQHVVERLAARLRRLDEDREIVARLRLTDEFGETLGTQRGFEIVVLAPFGRDKTVGGLVRVGLALGHGHGATHFRPLCFTSTTD